MKIAYCIRPNYLTVFGGDSVQVIKTRQFLVEKYGLDIDILTDPLSLTNEYDVVHVFNFCTIDFTRSIINEAKRLNIPIVSSCIYWDYSYASTDEIFKLLRYYPKISQININIAIVISKILSYLISKPIGISQKFKKNVRYFINQSNIVSPNSIEEGNLLLKFARLPESYLERFKVVYNATDQYNKSTNIDVRIKYNIPENYILQIGRIEFIKNQLNLLLALKNNPEIPIVFVGAIGNKLYYEKLKKISIERGNVFFIENVPHEEVDSFYKSAKLHVSLSLRESPGLVSIEAISNGCPVIISDSRFLPVKTYFNKNFKAINPLDLKVIRTKVIEEYNIPRNNLMEKQDVYSWDLAAEQTYKIYMSL